MTAQYDIKICPYCGAKDSLSWWIKSKQAQSNLKGNISPIDLKLKLPRCSECKNIMRYYLDAYRNNIMIKNPSNL